MTALGGSDGVVPLSPDSGPLSKQRGSLHIALLLSTAIIGVALVGSAQAAVPSSCLNLTAAKGLNTKAITSDLGLTPDQVREARGRLVTFNSVRGFEGLEGIGLTAEQVATMTARINAQVASWKPLGYPCAAFTHRTRTVAWVRSTLVANGFRSASIRVTKAVPRQLQLTGIQDGIDVWITVARTGPKGVAIRLVTTHSGGGTYAYVLPFVP